MEETFKEKVGVTALLLVCIGLLLLIAGLDPVGYYSDLPMIAAVELKTCEEGLK